MALGVHLKCDEIEALVWDFQHALLASEQWTHQAHLVVATWYCLRFAPEDAFARVRLGIQRLNAALGVPQTLTRGYHETLTRLYVGLVAKAVDDIGRDQPLETIVSGVLNQLTDRSIPLRYYSREVLWSWEARTSWVLPDLEPLSTGEPRFQFDA